MYKRSRDLLDFLEHVLGPIYAAHDGVPITCTLHSMLSHHVNHFEVAFTEGYVMLEYLSNSVSARFVETQGFLPLAKVCVEQAPDLCQSTA